MRLSNYAGSLFRPRLLFDHPRLALGDQRLEVGGLARGGSPVLLDYRGFEGRPRVFVNDAERHREGGWLEGHEHVRERAVRLVVHQHVVCCDATLAHGHDFELEFHDGTLWMRADSGEELWEIFSTSSPPIVALLRRLDERRGEEFHDAFVELFESYRGDGGVRAPRRYLLTLGRRR